MRKKRKLAIKELVILALLIWSLSLIQSLHAEIVQIDNDTVEMSVDDLREFVKDSEELRIIKENSTPTSKGNNFYLGANVGTYGVGIGAGIIF